MRKKEFRMLFRKESIWGNKGMTFGVFRISSNTEPDDHQGFWIRDNDFQLRKRFAG
jgi:hypothetical protein